MIYKHIGIVKEISRVGLPGFQSKDRVISVNFDLLCAAWRRRTQEQEERKSQRQFVRVSVTDLVTGLSTREEVESRFFFLDLRF